MNSRRIPIFLAALFTVLAVATTAAAQDDTAVDPTGISGKVEFPDGTPVKGARVIADPLGSDPLATGPAEVVTSETGGYFHALPPGNYRVRAVLGEEPGEAVNVRVRRNQTTGLYLVLSEPPEAAGDEDTAPTANGQSGSGATAETPGSDDGSGSEQAGPDPNTGVSGTVRLADGPILAGAVVVAQAVDSESGPVPDLAVLSEATGRYFWPLPPGKYRLFAIHEGRRSPSQEATVSDGRRSALDLTVE